MTDAERREAARQFYNKWIGRGKEDEDDRSYWIDFLQDVMGVEHVTDRIEFQKKVLSDKGSLSNRIDAYIPETRVLIEQKSLGIDLSKPQPGHNNKTPYEQAKEYDNALPVSEKAKWIIVSNFAEIWIYDMDTRAPEPIKLTLADITVKYDYFDFLINEKETKINKEMEVSVKAGEFVGLIYDALLKQYINPENEDSLKSLNMLCVRLVFCLYAEDAHIFGQNGHMFHDYMEQFETKDMRRALIELFKTLDTPENKRDPYDTSELSKFPYVNGGLFADENIEIPNFTEEIRDILLAKASEGFDWSMISPTIFGAVFESTLNPETRRSGGMHYTSIENIHKVIDPLFMDDLSKEFDEIDSIQVIRTKKQKLQAFQNKLSSLKWLDPACGSGNFLTETYLSVRRLENKLIRSLLNCEKGSVDGQLVMGEAINPIKVGISQFYGIEINDFAVTVAKTALWIAESQMMKETEDILLMHLDFLPLKTNAYIVEGNALRIPWEDVIPKQELNYIMGNPPFVGAMWSKGTQREDIATVFPECDKPGQIDYVAGWYIKAAKYINDTKIRCAFVSTNSVCQGQQVALIWKPMSELFNTKIDFAYHTFRWDSEANIKAHVHCIIVGFSSKNMAIEKRLYSDKEYQVVDHINGYLANAMDFFIDSRKEQISGMPLMHMGVMARDGGHLILSGEEYDEYIEQEPNGKQFIRPYMMGREFLNNNRRFCFWLVGANPSELKKCPKLMERIENVRKSRSESKAAETRKLAETPTLFAQLAQPTSSFIAFPKVSSERRRYIPIGFMDPNTIVGDKLYVVENVGLYHFGVLTSNVHNAWMRVVAGRLKSDYSYSNTIVYNNFPWPTPTDEQMKAIEQTAQGILTARKLYSESSLADLYDPLTMPVELKKAHIANDKAVMKAYGFSIKDTSESDCVEALMKLYQKLTEEKG